MQDLQGLVQKNELELVKNRAYTGTASGRKVIVTKAEKKYLRDFLPFLLENLLPLVWLSHARMASSLVSMNTSKMNEEWIRTIDINNRRIEFRLAQEALKVMGKKHIAAEAKKVGRS